MSPLKDSQKKCSKQSRENKSDIIQKNLEKLNSARKASVCSQSLLCRATEFKVRGAGSGVQGLPSAVASSRRRGVTLLARIRGHDIRDECILKATGTFVST